MAEVQERPDVKRPKPFDAEAEITKLWAKCQSAQDEIRRTFFQCRAAAIDMAGDGADEEAVTLKAWEMKGKDTAKSYFPRVRLDKPNLVENIAKLFVSSWRNQGAVVRLQKSENPDEVFIVWERCPWPTAHKQYGVSMALDVAGCDHALQTTLADVALFANRKLKIETVKAIPRGEGACVRRLWLEAE
ncbi:MAG: hypothetical protein M5U22_13520 [Thermoleophilia bacterium]|nr:hypothetical protein [Thermoleophilia bacterium]